MVATGIPAYLGTMLTRFRRSLVRFAQLILASTLMLKPALASELPPVLQGVVVDGEIPDGSWEWMRGALTDASPEQQRDWTAVEAWLTACAEEDRISIAAELAELGIVQGPDAETVLATQACAQTAALKSAVAANVAWPEFSARMGEARRVIDHYLFGASIAISEGPYDLGWTTDYGWEILRRSNYEQVLRKAMSWNIRRNAPQLDEALLPYLRAQLNAQSAVEDRANTERLEAIVAEHGWPRRSVVGAPVSLMAWLLAQHADHDPAFQLRALRLMEPLVEPREVSPSNYAYLYDRTMLKLVGRQRYGTQFGACEAGVRQLRPLEEDRDLVADRAAMELQPMDEYRAQMDRAFGACPS